LTNPLLVEHVAPVSARAAVLTLVLHTTCWSRRAGVSRGCDHRARAPAQDQQHAQPLRTRVAAVARIARGRATALGVKWAAVPTRDTRPGGFSPLRRCARDPAAASLHAARRAAVRRDDARGLRRFWSRR